MKKDKKLIYSWDEIPIIFDMNLACLITGFTSASLRTLAQSGKFPAYKVGGHWRIDRQEFMEWWENRKDKK